MTSGTRSVRRRLRVTGTVQGVGYRPFVYREATRLGLAGYVLNDSGGVLIEVEGPPAEVDELCRLLVDSAPPLARVESVTDLHQDEPQLRPPGTAPGRSDDAACSQAPRPDDGGFRIVESRESGPATVPVSVDSATCDDCVAEMFDPANRRYRYPFTNCTNCGPRYTIVQGVPYDRPATTMARFAMCEACRAEYEDPADRRFHAQPNACPACGPALAWRSPSGEVLSRRGEALGAAVGAIAAGDIVVLKGIGGYHFALDATDERAVSELRRRKSRDDKPFAVMVADLHAADELGFLSKDAVSLLRSHRRPIVLVPRRAGSRIAEQVAPGLPELGLLLPYSPLHHLLLTELRRPLVMTSGNWSDEPIAYEDDDALARLGPLAAGLLTHDRPIHVRCDDSVVRTTPTRTQLVRRARGYAPEPLLLPVPSPRQVLAVGAELKSTVSVLKGRAVVTSQHIGDLEHLASYRSFCRAVEHLTELFEVSPDLVAHDMHPEYLSTKWALERGVETLAVQHHHAHIASVLAEHGHRGRVLGVAFDGLGLGTDGTLWGGELMVADLMSAERVGHLPPVPLPGGAAAIREPWRMAISWLWSALGPGAAERLGAGLDRRCTDVLSIVASGRAPLTTSAGRLFDAVAALLGVRSAVTYEGQAAVELEALARREWPSSKRAPASPIPVPEVHDGVLDVRPLVAGVVDALGRGFSRESVAAGFHRGLGVGASRLAAELAGSHGLDTVALSGGVFQNVLLTDVMCSELHSAGLRVLVHERYPPNDGGISLGQAAVAAAVSNA